MIARRGFLSGLIGVIAAPAIVRAASLMPVSTAAVGGWPGLTAEEVLRLLNSGPQPEFILVRPSFYEMIKKAVAFDGAFHGTAGCTRGMTFVEDDVA